VHIRLYAQRPPSKPIVKLKKPTFPLRDFIIFLFFYVLHPSLMGGPLRPTGQSVSSLQRAKSNLFCCFLIAKRPLLFLLERSHCEKLGLESRSSIDKIFAWAQHSSSPKSLVAYDVADIAESAAYRVKIVPALTGREEALFPEGKSRLEEIRSYKGARWGVC
jgi:hypothetical protein